MVVIPAELTDLIIDDLQNSPITLKRCSLVCRLWLPRASLHLFRSFRVSVHNRHGAQVHREGTLSVFCKLLVSSVRVVANLRHLTLNLRNWAIADVAFTIPHLSQLQRLSVLDTNVGAPRTRPPCTGRHINYVQFHNAQLTLVSYFLGLFESVGTLELSTFTRGEGPLPPNAHQVKNLKISHLFADTLLELTELLELPPLERVEIVLGGTGQQVLSEEVNDFVKAVGSHIKHLELDMGCTARRSTVAEIPAMEHCTRLESFTIATPKDIRFEVAGWHGAVFFLRHLPLQTRTLRLITNFSFETEPEIRDTFRALHWQAVGDALERCPDLESLQLTVIKDDFGPLVISVNVETQHAIRGKLPVRLKGITVFE